MIWSSIWQNNILEGTKFENLRKHAIVALLFFFSFAPLLLLLRVRCGFFAIITGKTAAVILLFILNV